MLLVVVLTGCAPGVDPVAVPDFNSSPSATPPDAEPTPLPSATDPAPTASDDHEPITPPENRFGLSCSSILSSSGLEEILISPVTQIDPGQTDAYGGGISWYRALEQEQGLACIWTNGKKASLGDEVLTVNPDAVSVRIEILPDERVEFERSVSMIGPMPRSSSQSCGSPSMNRGGFCKWWGLAGGKHWVQIDIQGVRQGPTTAATVARFLPVKDSVIATVEKAALRPEWEIPGDVRRISTACPGVLNAETIGGAFGRPASVVKYIDRGVNDPYLDEVAAVRATSDACLFSVFASDSYASSIAILPAGEWAWLDSRSDGYGTFANVEPLPLRNLASGNSAWLRSNTYSVSADLLVDGNWISIDLPRDVFSKSSLDLDAVVADLAQGVADAVAE